jgi:hypothetical protein
MRSPLFVDRAMFYHPRTGGASRHAAGRACPRRSPPSDEIRGWTPARGSGCAGGRAEGCSASRLRRAGWFPRRGRRSGRAVICDDGRSGGKFTPGPNAPSRCPTAYRLAGWPQARLRILSPADQSDLAAMPGSIEACMKDEQDARGRPAAQWETFVASFFVVSCSCGPLSPCRGLSPLLADPTLFPVTSLLLRQPVPQFAYPSRHTS